ncbi:MAG: slipin family protein [Caldilineales bacterium]|nr:slipin family protein [Caldilineales bacterium]
MLSSTIGLLVFFLALAFIVLSAIKIVQEYERGVVFRLGRFAGVRGPGLILLIPFIERMAKVDLRVVALDVPAQECITRDNVTVKVNAVIYFFILDPQKAIINVEDYRRATWQIGQTTLRSVLGQHELDDLLSRRERINQELQRIIDEATEPWGVKVSLVEVKDVELPSTMQRAMAKQAEAERERRAKIIHAEGEYTASQQLAAAARVISDSPGTMQLRYLQSLTEIAVEQNSTIIFPLPIEFMRAFVGMFNIDTRPALPAAPASPPPVPNAEAMVAPDTGTGADVA